MRFVFELMLLINLVILQFKQIFIYWITGVLAGSILSVFASSRISSLVARMDKNRFNTFTAFFAALLGAASPICMYGTVPLIASLGRKGVPQYILAAFMVTSILINPNLFIFSFALGIPIALIRLSACILAGILAAILVNVFLKNKSLFNFDGFEEKKKCYSGMPVIKILLGDVHRGIVKTAPYFLVGILLTALFERYFPKNVIVSLFGNNKGFGVLLAASLGVPVYVCGGGTIPLLKAWMNAGMSSGSAIAFMISGAATKLTNLSAVKIILGIRNFILYIAFNILFAIAVGMVVDSVYGILR